MVRAGEDMAHQYGEEPHNRKGACTSCWRELVYPCLTQGVHRNGD